MFRSLTLAGTALTALGIAGIAAAGGTCCGSEKAAPMATTAGYGDKAKMDIVDTAVKAGDFNTLAAALKAAGLVETLKGDGPFTVFAPTDAAFAKLPAGTVEALLRPENRDQLRSILTYHVVSGKATASDVVDLDYAGTVNGQRVDITTRSGSVMVDRATVVKTDIMASNGVIHVIDEVILPNQNDIVETAVAANNFTTLAAALDAAGLVSTLQGDGPFTVFAPTDAAFAKLPAGTLESLLQPENRDKLTAILKYHVVSGRVYSDTVVGMNSVKTLEGSKASVRVMGGTVSIDGAKVIATDLDASNGVIHVIDTVMIPE